MKENALASSALLFCEFSVAHLILHNKWFKFWLSLSIVLQLVVASNYGCGRCAGSAFAFDGEMVCGGTFH